MDWGPTYWLLLQQSLAVPSLVFQSFFIPQAKGCLLDVRETTPQERLEDLTETVPQPGSNQQRCPWVPTPRSVLWPRGHGTLPGH